MQAGAATTHLPTGVPAVQVWLHGVFPEGTVHLARLLVGAALEDAEQPSGTAAASGVRVRLGTHRDPAVHFPVVAQVNLDLGGVPVRAQARAATAREALVQLQARLRNQLERAGHPPGGDEPNWRHPRPAKPWVAAYPRAAETRRIVRYKPCRLAPLGVDEAVHVLECMDYDFHLFTEIGTGQDSVLYRAGACGYRLAQLRPDLPHLAAHTVAVSCYDRPAPRLDAGTAVELLGMTEVCFLFFAATDPRAGQAGGSPAGCRGAVLYRRFDGHYGLLAGRSDVPAPRAEPAAPAAGPPAAAGGETR